MKSSNLRWKLLAACAALAASVAAGQAASTTVIYSFGGDEDGEYADTDLAADSAGNLYGTTVSGGDFGGGTVFQLSPTANGWVHTVLYNFTGGVDGGEPYKGVTLDAKGNLYGTAVTGGSGNCEGGCGVAYKLTKAGDAWRQKVIHAFTGGDDGAGPGARLAVDRRGNLYGMAPIGGEFGLGTIYQISPAGGGQYSLQVLHAFTGGADGATGSAGQMLLRNGRIYGVATAGGSFGSGAAFQLSRGQGGAWSFQTIYSFKGQPDAGFPYGALVSDAAGNLYGTTYYDGANDLGSVYELSPRATGEWAETVLYSFTAGKDGNSSIGNLVFDTAGNLYGTTSEGGAGGVGTIFKLTKSGDLWTETVVHSFRGPPDGAFAYNGMVVDDAGNFYGATVHGGADDEGAIYKFQP